MVSSLYKEPEYRIVEKIKNKPYFRWAKKNERGCHKEKLEPLLLISSRLGAHN